MCNWWITSRDTSRCSTRQGSRGSSLVWSECLLAPLPPSSTSALVCCLLLSWWCWDLWTRGRATCPGSFRWLPQRSDSTASAGFLPLQSSLGALAPCLQRDAKISTQRSFYPTRFLFVSLRFAPTLGQLFAHAPVLLCSRRSSPSRLDCLRDPESLATAQQLC